MTSSVQTSDPYAVTENWPAFGLYVEDSSCSLPSFMVAFAPNCNTYSDQGVSISTDLSCSDTGMTLSVFGTNNSVPYDECSGTPSEQRSMIPDQCVSFAGENPIEFPDFDFGGILDGSLKKLFALVDLKASEVYYYADCGGANNIPGIETNANSGPSSDSGGGVDAGACSVIIVKKTNIQIFISSVSDDS